MKKILNGKMYDTEKANKKGWYENTPYRSDFKWYSETLYQKKTGEFFLYGEGHAASPYAEACPSGGYDPGKKIKPLSYENAKAWAEKYLTADEYEEIFGEIAEDTERRSLNLSLSVAAVEKLKKISAQTGKTVSALIEEFAQGL